MSAVASLPPSAEEIEGKVKEILGEAGPSTSRRPRLKGKQQRHLLRALMAKRREAWWDESRTGVDVLVDVYRAWTARFGGPAEKALLQQEVTRDERNRLERKGRKLVLALSRWLSDKHYAAKYYSPDEVHIRIPIGTGTAYEPKIAWWREAVASASPSPNGETSREPASKTLLVKPGTGTKRRSRREERVRQKPLPSRTTVTPEARRRALGDRGRLREQSPEPLLRAFWAAHLGSQALTHIAYGTPTFTRSSSRQEYTRRIFLNRRRELERAHPKESICRPFVTLGDAICALNITQWMAAREVSVSTGWYKSESGLSNLAKEIGPRDAQDANIIVLGSTRHNGLVAEYQQLTLGRGRGYLPFRSDYKEVFRVDRDGRKMRQRWRERPYGDDEIVPALLTRREGEHGGVITVISSTSSRVVQRVGEVLTTENLLQRFVKSAGLESRIQRTPPRFQVVLTLRLRNDGGFMGQYAIEAVWVADTAHPRGVFLTEL